MANFYDTETELSSLLEEESHKCVHCGEEIYYIPNTVQESFCDWQCFNEYVDDGYLPIPL